jgi:UTP--glucose-1-phosphate uridylyltransferase
VLCARELVGNEPFFVHLPDDMILAERGCLAQLADLYQQTGCSAIAVETIPPEKTRSYGVAAVNAENRILSIVEKPRPEDAPSNLGVVGRYLLTPAIFAKLESTGRGSGGEIQLTDGIAALMADEAVYVLPFKGVRYDCGDKLGYLKANIDYALQRPDLAAGLRAHLSTL